MTAGGTVTTGAEPEPGLDSTEWQRMHPVTPAVKGWKVFVAVLALFTYQSLDQLQQLREALGSRAWLVVAGAIAVVSLVAFGYSAIAWRMTRYAITDEAVHLRSGVLFRQQRQARLDRLQAVDVVQPLLARILGLSELKLEVAGGSGSGISLAFLREQEAEVLRAELLARAAGVHRSGAGLTQAQAQAQAHAQTQAQTQSTDPAVVAPGVDGSPGAVAGSAAPTPGRPAAPVAPERQVYEVPVGRLIGSTVLSAATIWLVVVLAGVVTMAVVTGEIGSTFVLLPAVFGLVSFYWTRFNRGANFRAAISPDGIRLRHGLTEARAQTVPPGRVQAVRLTQGPLWRRQDWWRVEVNVAGYGAQDAQTDNVLLPVGTRAEALLALWLVLPDLGTADPRALVESGLAGRAGGEGFVTAPRRARWADPVAWRRHGVAVTERALLLRQGVIVRRLVVVPHERTQSLELTQGPIQRRLRLASIGVHSTPGPVVPRVDHLDERVAAGLMDQQAERAGTARAAAGPEMWMRSA